MTRLYNHFIYTYLCYIEYYKLLVYRTCAGVYEYKQNNEIIDFNI